MTGRFFLTDCRNSLKSDDEKRGEGEGDLRMFGGEGVEGVGRPVRIVRNSQIREEGHTDWRQTLTLRPMF